MNRQAEILNHLNKYFMHHESKNCFAPARKILQFFFVSTQAEKAAQGKTGFVPVATRWGNRAVKCLDGALQVLGQEL